MFPQLRPPTASGCRGSWACWGPTGRSATRPTCRIKETRTRHGRAAHRHCQVHALGDRCGRHPAFRTWPSAVTTRMAQGAVNQRPRISCRCRGATVRGRAAGLHTRLHHTRRRGNIPRRSIGPYVMKAWRAAIWARQRRDGSFSVSSSSSPTCAAFQPRASCSAARRRRSSVGSSRSWRCAGDQAHGLNPSGRKP